MKRLAGLAAVVLATLMGVLLLWRFRDAAILFIFSLVVAAAVRPATTYLTERNWPRGLALAAPYLLTVLVLGLLVFLVGGSLVGELQRGSDAFAAAYERFRTDLPDTGVARLLAARLPQLTQLYQGISQAQGSTLAGNAVGFTLSFFGIVTNVVIVLVLSIYWGSDQVHFERLWLSLLPAEQRGRARNIWRAIEVGVGSYVRSEVIQSLVAGLLLGAGFALLGLPIPILLALVCALAWLIPLVGGVIALGPVAAVAILQGPWLALVACLYTVAIFVFLELVVERRLFDRRRYSSILTVLVMIAMANAIGVWGLVIAPPLAAAIQIFFRELWAQPFATARRPEQTDAQLDQLRDRLRAAQSLAADLEEPATPELTNLMQRLGTLIDEVDETVEDDWPRVPPTGLARIVTLPERERVKAK